MATSRLSPSETSNRNAPLGPVALSGPLMRIGKYDVQSEIGQGREIKVYRAFDRGLGRPVTLKLLTAQAEEALCERFRSEVAIAGKLKSESFIAIYDLGEHAGRPFAAMHVMGGDHLG